MKKIHAIRCQLGLTQREFAAGIGCREASVSDWERGVQKPSPLARKSIENFLSSLDYERKCHLLEEELERRKINVQRVLRAGLVPL